MEALLAEVKSPLDAVIDAVARRLQFVAPTATLERELAKLTTPPRYVWVPRSTSYAGPSIVGGSPRSLHDRLVRSDVHCWAHDLAGTERLELALVTALREAVQGANYTVSGGEWLQPDWVQQGIVYTLTIELRLPCPMLRIPEVPCGAAPYLADLEVCIDRIDPCSPASGRMGGDS